MKQILLLLTLSMILFSCKKDEPSSIREQIRGKWYFLKTINPEILSPLPPDTTENISIGSDGSYERRLKDVVLFRGTYSLIEKRDCYGNENRFLFKTSEQPGETGAYIRVNPDTLILSTSNCYIDRSITFYIKN